MILTKVKRKSQSFSELAFQLCGYLSGSGEVYVYLFAGYWLWSTPSDSIAVKTSQPHVDCPWTSEITRATRRRVWWSRRDSNPRPGNKVAFGTNALRCKCI